jgi:hypothetical protein
MIAMENNSPKLKIMTYDDILAYARAIIANILGEPWEDSGAVQIYLISRAIDSPFTAELQ